jgi:two-component system, OmpR family, alkaline phosphatase synthesis response regulator PhoP
MSEQNKRIVVVDDDDTIREILENVLVHSGYKVDLCGEALKAIDLIQTGEKPAVIILDIMMEYMDGLEILERLKKIDDYNDIPIIVITAMKSDRIKDTSLDAGASEFLKKPLNIDFFMKLVNEYSGYSSGD